MERRITGRYCNLCFLDVFYYFRSVFVDRFEKVMHIHYGQVEFYKVTPIFSISLSFCITAKGGIKSSLFES